MEPTTASAIRCVDTGARNRRPATPAVFMSAFRCTPADQRRPRLIWPQGPFGGVAHPCGTPAREGRASPCCQRSGVQIVQTKNF